MANIDDKFTIGVAVDQTELTAGLKQAVSQITASAQQMSAVMGNAATRISTANAAISNSMNTVARTSAQSMNTVTQSANSTQSSFDKLKATMGAIGISIAASLAMMAKSALEHERSLVQLSRTTGMSIEDASKWSFAAKMSGVDVDSFKGAIMGLARQLMMAEKSMESGKDRFHAFGVEVKDGNNKLLPTGQILENIAARYQTLAPGMERTRFAFAMFRGEAQSMIPFLEMGAEGIRKLRGEAEKYGMVMTDVTAFKAYIAATRQLNAAWDGMRMQIGNALMPAITALSTGIANMVRAFNSIDPGTRSAIVQFVAFGGALLTVFGGLAALKTILTVIGFERLGMAIGVILSPMKSFHVLTTAIIAVIGGLWRALSALPAAFSAGTLGLRLWASWTGIAAVMTKAFWAVIYGGVAIVAALALAWATNFNNIQEATAQSINAIAKAFTDLWEHIKTIAGGIAKVIGGSMLGDMDMIKEGIADVKTSWSGAMTSMSDIGANAWGGFKTAGSTIIDGIKKLVTPNGLFGNVPAGTGEEFTPDFGGKDDKKSPFDHAKIAYEQDLALHNYNLREKLAKYKEYLSEVVKTEEETKDYLVGLKEADVAAQKEANEEKKANIEIALSDELITETEASRRKIALMQEEIKQYAKGSEERIKTEVQIANEIARIRDHERSVNIQRMKSESDYRQTLIALDVEHTQHLADMNMITAAEEQRRLTEYARQAYEEKRRLLEEERSQYTLNSDKYREYTNQLKQLDNEWAVSHQTMINRIVSAETEKIRRLYDDMANSLDQSIQGIIKGTAKIGDLFRGLADTMTQYLTRGLSEDIMKNLFGDMMSNYIAQVTQRVTKEQAATAMVRAAGNKAELIEAKVQAAAIGAIGASQATAMISATAAAFTGTLSMMSAMAAAIAAIPPEGPAMAAGITAGVTAATAALTAASTAASGMVVASYGTVASAAGGLDVQKDQLAYIHEKEFVLPRNLSDGFRNIIANQNGASNQSAPMNSVSVPVTVNGGDNRLAGRLRREIEDLVVRIIAQESRA